MSVKIMDMIRLPITLMVVIMVSGCATGLKQEVSLLESENARTQKIITAQQVQLADFNNRISNASRDISSARESSERSRKSLAEHQTSISRSQSYFNSKEGRSVYVDNRCILPSRGEKPQPFCGSRAESREFALSYCSMSIGCDVALSMFDDKLDTFSKKFLASEACSRSVAKMHNMGYSDDQTIVNAFSAAASSACNNQREGIFAMIGKAWGCLTAGAIYLQKLESYQKCLNREGDRCYNNTLSWENAPAQRRNVCQNHISNIAERKKEIASANAELKRNQKLILESENLITQYNSKIQSLQPGLQRAQTRFTSNNARLDEIKNSVQWKLFGDN
ncbi:MAG: hypothetical protein RBQ99_09695 [Trichlorobacter sp.]|nr:hypothetical protein [Trichlorobacter sp.]